MIETLLTLNILTIVALGIVLTYFNRRQARALEEGSRTLESWFFFNIKRHRESVSERNLVPDPLAWIKTQAREGLGEEFQSLTLRRALQPLAALEFIAPDGRQVVISPNPERVIRQAARSTGRNGKQAGLSQAFEETPLLLNRAKARSIQRSLANAGDYFDLEAAQVGKALGVNWGQPESLWFYVVPN